MSETLTGAGSPERASSLTRPDNTEALEEAMLHISGMHAMSFIDQLILAGATRLLIKGAVTRNGLTLIACELYGAPQPPNDGDTLSDALALAAANEAWDRLQEVVNGTMLDSLRSVTSIQQWTSDVMHALKQASNWGQVENSTVAKELPEGVLDCVYNSFARSWYGCLESIGRSLEETPGGSVSSGLPFGTKNQGVYFAHAVATALSDSIVAYGRYKPDSEKRAIELSNVTLWTRLLKAYLYSLVQRYTPNSVFEVLSENPQMLHGIIRSLTDGVLICRSADNEGIEPSVMWTFHDSDYSREVWSAKSDDILAKLEDLVNKAAKDKSYGPPL